MRICPRCGADLTAFNEDDYTVKLIAALRHPEPFTQRRAAYVLGLRRDGRAVAALIEAMDSSADVYVRGEAAAALGKIGGPQAEAALRRVLADRRASAVLRRAATDALAQITSGEG
ncbi:MAG: HEAT repeat domain-containing protein [Caldilineales bacterium]|nr:HEAT repeat domain-containing protein [Caldilineales bacterium]MDW8316733.1 HEAT repeat domain-containing protein [Anaerolineae bacterium]